MKNYIVAGSCPATQKNSNIAAFWDAAAKLDTDAILLKYAFDKQTNSVFYLAYPAQHWPNTAYQTVLCSALPGASGYKGDGLYYQKINEEFVGILKVGTKFESLHFSKIDEAVGNFNIQTYDVSVGEEGSLIKHNAFLEKNAYDLAKKTTTAFFGIGSVAFCLSIVLQLSGWFLASKNDDLRLQINENLAQLSSKMAQKTDIYDRTAELRRLSAVVAKSGGFISSYALKRGGDSAFEIIAPEWVTQDYVLDIGSNVKAERDISRNAIIFRKGAKQ